MLTEQVLIMSNCSSKQVLRDEKLLLDKIIFLNKSGSKYVIIGISPIQGFQLVIKLCSSKSKQCVRFTEYEWLAFWAFEGIFCNCLSFQNTNQDPIYDGKKNYNFGRINNEMVLKINDMSCDGEIFIGKVSFWRLQEIRMLVTAFLEELKSLNILETYGKLLDSLENTGNTDCASKILTALEQKKATTPFLIYYAIHEYVVYHSELVNIDIQNKLKCKTVL